MRRDGGAGPSPCEPSPCAASELAELAGERLKSAADERGGARATRQDAQDAGPRR
jgi:hypothetical protein